MQSNRSGWAAFHKHKGELCSKFYPVGDRLRLFDSVVSAAVLYGCSSWALTQELERKLTTARRRMLRYVLRIHRKLGEDWIEFVKGAAHRIDDLSLKFGLEARTVRYRRRKWRFAGALASCTYGRWSKVVVQCRPNGGFGRGPGAPRTRWEDQLCKLAGGDWMATAMADPELWRESAYI